jgi:hypothetical protein
MNSWLDAKMMKVIKAVQADEDQEITWEKGAGYWVGYSRVNTKACEQLLRLCLIRPSYTDNKSEYIVYTLTAEVDNLIADEKYTPAIITAMRTGEPQFVNRAKSKPKA